MKQGIKGAMALLMAVVLLSACAKAPDENETALQDRWAAYLEAQDRIYGDMHWALSYAEQFAREETWDSLQKARASCCAAILSLEQLELPENTLTQEQYMALMEKGIEADVVSVEYGAMERERSYNVDTMTCLLYLLRDDIYLAPSAGKVSDWVKSSQDNLALQCEYLCLTTNYLLLQMEDRTLWQELETRFPTVAASRGEWSEDPDQLQVDCALVLDKMAAQLSDQSAYLGISEYTLGIVREAVSSGDLTRLSEQIYTIGAVPAYFPLPGWVSQEALWYYLIPDAEPQEKRLIQAGEESIPTPTACYIACAGISLEDVQAYEERLAYWNAAYRASGDGQTYQIFAISGGSQMLIRWTEEETVIYLTEPVACLIPELYLQAMTAG